MNTFNKKTILFFSLTSLMINGCVAKNGFETKTQQLRPIKTNAYKNNKVVNNKIVNKAHWGKVAFVKAKKDDCVNCYASPMDYSKPPSAINNPFVKYSKIAKNKVQKHFGGYDYKERASDTAVKTARANTTYSDHIVSVPVATNSSYGSLTPTYNTGTMSIQVGAFRKYSGAKKYVRRYSALSNKYKVAMKKGTKNNQAIYRVRIEGFKNRSEAKNFMYSYGITDGFLVRN